MMLYHPISNPPGNLLRVKAPVLVLLVLAGCCLLMPNGFGNERPASVPRHRLDRILVQPKANLEKSRHDRWHARQRCKVMRRFNHLGGIELLELPAGADIEAVLAQYRASGLVEYAEPDYLYSIAETEPDDPSFENGTLWALSQPWTGSGINADINAPQAWDLLHDAPEVIVAVVDTGVRQTHEDLVGNLWVNPGETPGNGIDDDGNSYVDDVHGVNAIRNDGNPEDDNGHGTHVAGIVGAVGNNGIGVTGVAWNVRIMALKFMDASGDGSISDALQCVNYAIAEGADVINASWVGNSYSFSLRRAIQRADDAGIIFVAAAGNDHVNIEGRELYPVNYDVANIVSVTAIDRQGYLADYSNYGSNSVDLAAPGSGIYSTARAGDRSYESRNGTSMAAPIVSGAFALMKARFPELSHRELIDRILDNTQPMASLTGMTRTGGLLDLDAALRQPLEPAFSFSPDSGDMPLAVEFADLTPGDITFREWDFGDGSAPVAEDPTPTHWFRRPGEFSVTLTVRNHEGTERRVSHEIATTVNYRVEPAAFEWVELPGGVELPLGRGEVSAPIGIFPFTFYGESHDQIYVSANGMVGFHSGGLSQTANTSLPSTSDPNGMLCPYWDYLDPESGGTIRVGTVGSAPLRRFVVSWIEIPTRAQPAATVTFQAVIEESTQTIGFNYLDVDAASKNGAGWEATLGIENPVGTQAVLYSLNGGIPLVNEQSLRFLPPATTLLEVESDTRLQATLDETGAAHPAGFELRLTNHDGQATAWTISREADWLVVQPASGLLAPGATATVRIDFSVPPNPGRHEDVLFISSTADGDRITSIPVRLEVSAQPAFSISSVSNGLEFILTAAPGSEYRIESSPDLRQWMPVLQAPTSETGELLVLAERISGIAQRFYRAVRVDP